MPRAASTSARAASMRFSRSSPAACTARASAAVPTPLARRASASRMASADCSRWDVSTSCARSAAHRAIQALAATWRTASCSVVDSASACSTARSATAWRACRLARAGNSCIRPIRFMVMSSARPSKAWAPVTGQLSRPKVSLGSGRAAARIASSRAAWVCDCRALRLGARSTARRSVSSNDTSLVGAASLIGIKDEKASSSAAQ